MPPDRQAFLRIRPTFLTQGTRSSLRALGLIQRFSCWMFSTNGTRPMDMDGVQMMFPLKLVSQLGRLVSTHWFHWRHYFGNLIGVFVRDLITRHWNCMNQLARARRAQSRREFRASNSSSVTLSKSGTRSRTQVTLIWQGPAIHKTSSQAEWNLEQINQALIQFTIDHSLYPAPHRAERGERWYLQLKVMAQASDNQKLVILLSRFVA